MAETKSTLAYVLAESLKLLHPFMPFITEELWQKLPGREGSIMVSAFPRPEPGLFCPEAEEKLELLMEVVRAARNLRSERKIPPSEWIMVSLFPEAGTSRRILEENLKLVSVLARARDVKLLSGASELGGAPAVARDVLVEIGVGGTSSRKEAERLQQELAKFRKAIRPLELKLENPDYQAKASPEAVAKTRSRYEELLIKIRKTEEGLKLLEGKA
ncbi:MAG: class I tRNA ligase family protein [Proteobacteria bacterium]|nr:class I tRNA ligase family protein [Pseudomonadota bacterium]